MILQLAIVSHPPFAAGYSSPSRLACSSTGFPPFSVRNPRVNPRLSIGNSIAVPVLWRGRVGVVSLILSLYQNRIITRPICRIKMHHFFELIKNTLDHHFEPILSRGGPQEIKVNQTFSNVNRKPKAPACHSSPATHGAYLTPRAVSTPPPFCRLAHDASTRSHHSAPPIAVPPSGRTSPCPLDTGSSTRSSR